MKSFRPTQIVMLTLALLTGLSFVSSAAAQSAKKKRKRAQSKTSLVAPGGLHSARTTISQPRVHKDFPALRLLDNKSKLVAFVEHDGSRDTLKAARFDNAGAAEEFVLHQGGDIFRPAAAPAPDNAAWIVWSELIDGRWDLRAGRLAARGAKFEQVVDVATNTGNNVFATVAADRHNRLWIAWQRMHGGLGDIFTRWIAPDGKSRSREFRITRTAAGEWEPRLAFGADDDALILFDSYESGDFDLKLARVTPEGKTALSTIIATPRYEARAAAAPTRDGSTLWVAYEEGIRRWGKDLGSEWRKIGGGLNYDRRIKLAKVDLKSGRTSVVADLTQLVPGMLAARGRPDSSAVNRPDLIVDKQDRPWLFFRYAAQKGVGYWQIAFSAFDPKSGKWTAAKTLENSAYCQDRKCELALDDQGWIHAVWPGDKRTSKQQRLTAIHATRIDPGSVPPADFNVALPVEIADLPDSPLKAFNDTPERNPDERHSWNIDGEEYTLYWGDVHRHTDFSNCRTTDDGCIVEHFRYAIDAGGLDYLATSDHTEVGKTLSAYEWWQTQKLADVFQNPGRFLSFYAYEREQKWPYGHRNVVFIERGGPVVYIKRDNYARSQWATPLPPADGVRDGEIPPWQLWDLLRKHGQRAITIEHTSAGAMGTDWSVYEKIDSKFENIIEVFQGSRESYEGVGAPQPPIVGGRQKQFGKFNAGTWQNALRHGHRLGAFTSSDHRSTHISYGGVYVKKFDRAGVFDAMDARRTIAATDKIFMEFSCNGKPLGESLETSTPPVLKLSVAGTAPVARVTLVRNEQDYKIWKPDSANFAAEFTDRTPLEGENRYYLRVEQSDGNMGWTSPVWATFKPAR